MTCDLCFGDGWIGDSFEELQLCVGPEKQRFLYRMDYGSRMACPRCQPDWKPPIKPPEPEMVWKRPPAWWKLW